MNSALIYRHLEPYLVTQIAKATTSIDILCPFVRCAVLRRLLVTVRTGTKIRLVMRWSLRDFLEGHSDPDVFCVCTELGAELWHHPTLHMKLWCVDQQHIIATSANISERALGIGQGDNREFLVPALPAQDQDMQAIDSIFAESRRVTDKMFLAAQSEIGSAPIPEPVLVEQTQPLRSLDQLPQTTTPMLVWKDYSAGRANEDVRRYRIPTNLDELRFMEALAAGLFHSPFVADLTQRLRGGSLFFGELKQWIRDSCTDTPTPSARDLTPTADALLNWLEGLGGGKYTVERPNVSELLAYDTNVQPEPLLSLPGKRTTQSTDPHG